MVFQAKQLLVTKKEVNNDNNDRKERLGRKSLEGRTLGASHDDVIAIYFSYFTVTAQSRAS